MQTVALLRKQLDEGYISTYRFSITADGRHIAVSNTGKLREFASRYAQERAIEGFIRIGYARRTAAPAIKRLGEEMGDAPIF